ncbi:septum formation protein Maf [Candidatus Peregrinibacteria bacterium CG10_big_fil_rev_8_21_14_0_10_55_24]|nr:MAG: septum formation protein Maf [Candidatus Peregrinibacteria bacterium CG10_big_fil_rev_8_21_14_0_10_55_24]
MHHLILASASPQRRRLFEGLGVPFTVVPSAIDEAACKETDPLMRAQILARLKAEDVAERHPDAWVIGCDTLVVSPQGKVLEKPRDAAEARVMLREQSGGISLVHSALALLSPASTRHEGISTSRVRFRPLTPEHLDWWIGTGLWEGRSGSFQIEGPGQLMIDHLEGDWSGVVGLPVSLLGELAHAARMPYFM